MKKLLIYGNSTMPKNVGIWNLPAEVTCTPSPWCSEHCYAKKGRFCWTNVSLAHYNRYERTFHPYFTDDMIEEIYTSNVRYVRVHISGDFFSREYVLQWKSIASELPDVIFRTNTRRRDMLQLIGKEFPDNFIVRESTDPTRKVTGHFSQHAIIGTPGSKDFFVCKNNCEKCKFYCWKNPEANIVTEKIL